MAAKKQASGGARLKAAGRHPMLLGPTEAEWQRIRAAAEMTGQPATQLVLSLALRGVEKILKKSADSA